MQSRRKFVTVSSQATDGLEHSFPEIGDSSGLPTGSHVILKKNAFYKGLGK
jgi:hypothetical protein